MFLACIAASRWCCRATSNFHNAVLVLVCTFQVLQPLVGVTQVSRQSPAQLLLPLLVCALQGMFDKLCDISLVIKSICLHTSQLTSLTVEKNSMLTAKAVAAMAEMPLLSSLTLKSGHGFEPGALAPVSGIKGLTALHLEIFQRAGNFDSKAGPGGVSDSAGCPSAGPHNLECLMAADEVALVTSANIVSFTAVNLSSCTRPLKDSLVQLAAVLCPVLPIWC